MSAEEIESYKFQLEQVELALQADANNEELQKLQTDLKELIAMFESVNQEAANTESPPTKKRKSESSPSAATTTALKLHEFSVDQEVMARWSGDGQFYKATITAIGGADQVFSVKFKGYSDVEFVKAEDIKAIATKKREPGIFEVVDKKKKKKEPILPVVPPPAATALPATPANALKKKKASEFESKKSAWLNFATGSNKKKKVTGPVINKKSIFKTPDNPHSKVGVVGSGKGMTSYQQRGKHIYTPTASED